MPSVMLTTKMSSKVDDTSPVFVILSQRSPVCFHGLLTVESPTLIVSISEDAW